MSEFYNDTTPEVDAISNVNLIKTQDGGFDTDVPDIKAPSMHNNLPVFDVDTDDFYNNLRNDRKRLKFKNPESTISKYITTSKYNRPFYMKTTDNKMMRKIN